MGSYGRGDSGDYGYDERGHRDEYDHRGSGPRSPPPGGPDPARGRPATGPPLSPPGLGARPQGGNTSLGSKKFRDRWKIKTASKQDLWKVTILKLTARDELPPKEKHMRDMLDGVNYGGEDVSDRNSAPGSVLHHLEKRVREPDWVVSIKSLTGLHFLLRYSWNEPFVQHLSGPKRSVFDMSGFRDLNPSASSSVNIVKSYGAYLTQLAALKAETNFPPTKTEKSTPEDDKHYPKKYRQEQLDEVLAHFPLIMQTLEVLMRVELGSPRVAARAKELVRIDFAILWESANECADSIAHAFFTLDPRKGNQALAAKNMFSRFVIEFPKMLEEAGSHSPELKSVKVPPEPPYDLLDDMEDHMRNAPTPGLGGALMGGRPSEFDRYERGSYDAFRANRPTRGGPPGPAADGQAGGGFFLLDDFSEGSAKAGKKTGSFNPFEEEANAEAGIGPNQNRPSRKQMKEEQKRQEEMARQAQMERQRQAAPFTGAHAARGNSEFARYDDPSFDPFSSQAQNPQRQGYGTAQGGQMQMPYNAGGQQSYSTNHNPMQQQQQLMQQQQQQQLMAQQMQTQMNPQQQQLAMQQRQQLAMQQQRQQQQQVYLMQQRQQQAAFARQQQQFQQQQRY